MLNPQLRTFLCVAESGSFSKAAEQLYLSSTAVIKQINALERSLGLTLLQRTHHGVSLTPAGRIIQRYGQNMEEAERAALQEARALQEAEQKSFRIGTSLLNPCKPFMDLWYPVSREFPGYHLQIIPFDDDQTGILTELDRIGDKFDCIVGVCDSKQWMDRCRFLPLGTYQHEIAVPRGHRLAGRRSIRPADLSGETVLLVTAGDSAAVDGIRSALSAVPEIRLEDAGQFYDMSVFNKCVSTNCAMVSLPCWEEVHPALVHIPVEWDAPIPYGILYPLHPSDDVSRLIRAIQLQTRSL